MLRHKTIKEGYILPLTLSLLAASIVVITYVYWKTSFFVAHGKNSYKMSLARMYSLNGIEIAKALLDFENQVSENEDASAPKDPQKSKDNDATLYAHITNTIGKVYEFNCTKAIEGFDARIKIVLFVEDGKLDINSIYDYTKHTFRISSTPEKSREAMSRISKKIEEMTGIKDVITSLEKFLSKRTAPLNDITELLAIPEFRIFDQFRYASVDTVIQEQYTPHLGDIFTVQTGKQNINAWFLSKAWVSIAGFQSSILYTQDQKQRSELIQWIESLGKSLNNFKDTAVLYQKLYNAKIDTSFTTQYSFFVTTKKIPAVFSAAIECMVNGVSARLYVIFQRVKRKKKEGNSEYKIEVKKLYWI